MHTVILLLVRLCFTAKVTMPSSRARLIASSFVFSVWCYIVVSLENVLGQRQAEYLRKPALCYVKGLGGMPTYAENGRELIVVQLLPTFPRRWPSDQVWP